MGVAHGFVLAPVTTSVAANGGRGTVGDRCEGWQHWRHRCVRVVHRWPRVDFTAVGPHRHGPLGLCSDGQCGIDADVGGHRQPIDHVQSRMPIQAVVGIDDTGLGTVTDGAATQEVGGHRDIDHLADAAERMAADVLRQSAHGLVRYGDPGRVRQAVALAGRQSVTSEPARLRTDGQGVVVGLHDEADDGELRPVIEAEHQGRHVAGVP